MNFKKNLISLALLAASTTALAVDFNELPAPETFGNTFVSDAADILSPENEKLLDDNLIDYYQSTGGQVAVFTTADTSGSDSPRTFANKLFEKFEFGDAGVDNGLLILLSVGDRRIEFESGYGVEGLLPDVMQYRIQQEYMIPFFKEGDYEQGLMSGTYATIEELRDAYAKEETYLASGAMPPSTIAQFETETSLQNTKQASESFLGLLLFLFGSAAALIAGYFAIRSTNKSTPKAKSVRTNKVLEPETPCRLCNKPLPRDAAYLPVTPDQSSDFELKVVSLGVADVKALECPSCGYANKKVTFAKRMNECGICHRKSNYVTSSAKFLTSNYINTYIDKIDRSQPLQGKNFKTIKDGWIATQTVNAEFFLCYMCENTSSKIDVGLLPQKPAPYKPKPSTSSVKHTTTSSNNQTQGSVGSSSSSRKSKSSSIGSSWGSSSRSRSSSKPRTSSRKPSKPRSRGGRSGGGGAGSSW